MERAESVTLFWSRGGELAGKEGRMLSGGEKGRNWGPSRRRGFLTQSYPKAACAVLGVTWVPLVLEVCKEGQDELNLGGSGGGEGGCDHIPTLII